MRNIIYLIIFLLTITNIPACSKNTDNQKTVNTYWGIGFLTRKGINIEFHVFDVPKKQLLFYKKPSFKAEITKRNFTKFSNTHVNHSIKGKKLNHIYRYDFIEVGYEAYCLKVYGEKNGFVRLLANTSKEELWIPIKQLKKYGYEFVNYKRLLLHIKEGLFVSKELNGLNLRKSSRVNSKKFVTLRNDKKTIIELTGKSEGNWFEAKVNLYDGLFYESNSRVIKSYTGWLKGLDDTGYPNLWFLVRGM